MADPKGVLEMRLRGQTGRVLLARALMMMALGLRTLQDLRRAQMSMKHGQTLQVC